MQIKNYQQWLLEQHSHSGSCGHDGSFLTENVDMAQVIRLLNEEQINEAGQDFGPFKAGKGGISQPIKCEYAPGYYSVDHTSKPKVGTPKEFKNSAKFKQTLDDMIAFIKAEPAKTWISKVIVKSGESIIPNFDMEKGTGVKEIGWLSNERKKKISEYVNSLMKPLLDTGLVSKLPEVKFIFEEAKTLTEPSGGWEDYKKWNRESDPTKKAAMPTNAEYAKLKAGYDADQQTNVQFAVVADLGPAQCMVGLKLQVNYDDTKIGHTCEFARFQITVNGIPLKTYYGGHTDLGWVPAGLPYASLNNDQSSVDDLYLKDRTAAKGGIRKNLFLLSDPTQIRQIIAAGDGKTLVVRAKCIVNGAGFGGKGGCHTDAPHVYVYTPDGQLAKGFPTYPRTNDGELAKTDICGNNLGQQNLTSVKSADSKGTAPAGPKLTGVKLGFAAPKVGTLTSDQTIQNYITNGIVTKQTDGTYLVNKPVLPKGTVIPQPVRTGVAPK